MDLKVFSFQYPVFVQIISFALETNIAYGFGFV